MIAHGLLQHGLSEWHSCGLALHYHYWMALGTENNGIGTFVQTVHFQRILHSNKPSRHFEMFHKQIPLPNHRKHN